MNRLTIAGLVIVTVLVFVALFAPWIAPYDVGTTNLAIRYLAPSSSHWFGTDSTGRDIFSRVVFGARISLQVGIIVVAVSAVIGTFLGAIAGYYGGWIDRFVSGYVFNVFLAFPGLLLAIAMVAFLGAGLICNLAVRPVDRGLFTLAPGRKVAQAHGTAGEGESGAWGLVAIGWLLAGIPTAWGIYKTLALVSQMFR